TSPQPRNNDSLVLHLRYRDSSALLEGDAESMVEEMMVAGHDLRADLLKVGHHGSNTSSTSEMLHAVHPRWALISVGARNPFGHPRKPRCGGGGLPAGPGGSGNHLLGRTHSQRGVDESLLRSTSAVSSSLGERRNSSITRRASSASSARTRITVPPTPGNMSWIKSTEVMS